MSLDTGKANIHASGVNGRLVVNAEDGYEFGFATQYDPNPDVTSSLPAADTPEVTVNGAFDGNADYTYNIEFQKDGTVGSDEIGVNVTRTGGGTTETFSRTIEQDHLISDAIQLDSGLSINLEKGGEVLNGDTVTFTARKSMDPQGLLDPLGVNTMFDGLGAGEIHVNEDLNDDARLLATSLSESSGDNERLLDMVELEEKDVLDSQSLHGFYRNVVSNVANERNTKDTQLTSLENVVSDLQDARDGISGVSVEEEMMKMMQSQRMYQGLTKYVQSLNSAYGDLLRVI